MVQVNVAVEGGLDESAVTRLLEASGHSLGIVRGKRGKVFLDQHVEKYNQAAMLGPWFVLRDLDADADCAPTLVQTLLRTPAPLMRFRIAVRTVEAWLLADRVGLARFLGVSEALLPRQPEDSDDPKQDLVNLARRSRKRTIRGGLVPAMGHSGTEGPLYTALLSEFVLKDWDLETAAERSPSLAGALAALQALAG